MDKIAYIVTKDENTYAMSADGEKYSLTDILGALNDYIDLGPIDRLRELTEADGDGRLVVLEEKPMPLVLKPDSTDAYCPYCGNDVSGCWGIDDTIPEICQCPECGGFIDVNAKAITREAAEKVLEAMK